MTQTVTAIYEGGMLRPLKPLHLRERQTVLLNVIPTSGDDEIDRITVELVLSGALTLPQDDDEMELIPEEELSTLARQVAASIDRPLSEIIIEERGEW